MNEEERMSRLLRNTFNTKDQNQIEKRNLQGICIIRHSGGKMSNFVLGCFPFLYKIKIKTTS